MANRDRQHQGLVYGPVRPAGRRNAGRIVANAIGLLLVVVTIGVLGVGIYLLLDNRGGGVPTNTPTIAPTAHLTAAPGASR